MKIAEKEILPQIYLLTFETQLELASTFLRFQEYYESPEFKGRIFTLEEYKPWYSKHYGSFTYYEDWGGFNIPSEILEPFYEGLFDPLSDGEKELLELLAPHNGKYYVIAVCRSAQNGTIEHEIAHALYYLNIKYRSAVNKLLLEYSVEEIKNKLRKDGYREDVLLDEIQAYVLANPKQLKLKYPEELREKLRSIYSGFTKIGSR